jgi:hypothetical protein
MSLSAAERAQKTLYLAEAEAALHSLNLGRMASVFVDQNGERVEFNKASRPALRLYITELKTALGTVTVLGPMNFGMR